MSELIGGFQRWARLMDRAARDERLTAEEQTFCEHFARHHAAAQLELAAYRELEILDTPPDTETRALVDSALRRLEAEDTERAVADVRSLRPNRVPFWLATTAAAVALIAVAFMSRARLAPAFEVQAKAPPETARPLTRAELVYASGHVQVDGRLASAGRVLLTEGTRIVTGAGVACVLVDSDINLCLAANSSMRLATLSLPARLVELESGEVATRLSTQPEGHQLTIAAGDVTSTAVGTAFSVERQAGQPVLTTVLNGKVRVAHGGAKRVVNAHERARSAANDVQVNSLSRTEETSAWALLGPTMLWHDPVSATLELSGEPEDAEATLDGQPIGRAPLSSLVPVGAHRLTVRQGESVLFDQELYWNAGESRAVHYRASEVVPTEIEPRRRKATRTWVPRTAREVVAAKVAEPEPPPPAEATPTNSGPTPADLLRSARRLVRDGQLRAAADTYHNLRRSYPGSQEAHTVLVSLGQLQLSALHNPEEAIKLLDLYLQRGGTLSEEARLTRIHALRALRRREEEVVAISEFLLKHPRSFEDSTLRARLADLRATAR